jgi:hypothetical protein
MTETVSTAQVEEIANIVANGIDLGSTPTAIAERILASRTQSPAEWQVAKSDLEALGINLDTLVVRSQPFGELIDAETRKVFTPPLGDAAYPICRALKALRAASSPAPERSKEEVVTERGRHLWVMEEIAASLLTGDRSAATKLREAIDFFYALKTPPLHKEGEAAHWENIHTGDVRKTKPLRNADDYRPLYAAPQPAAEAEVKRLTEEKEAPDEHGFVIGAPVEKFTGEARWEGVLVAAYLTTTGHRRYVVEVKPQGFQMIAVPSQLRMIGDLARAARKAMESGE